MSDISESDRLAAIADLEATIQDSQIKVFGEDGTEITDFDYIEYDIIEYDDEVKDKDYQPPSPKKAKQTRPPSSSSSHSSTKMLKKEREFDMKVAICEEVRKYPALYQITHKKYSNKGIKDSNWKEISETLTKRFGPAMTIAYCKKLWDALRESTRNYMDKSKVSRIREKSGAPADLIDLYDDEGSANFDIYNDRWEYSTHMTFFMPACARSAYTVSIGNSTANTNIKKKINHKETEDIGEGLSAFDIESFDPDETSRFTASNSSRTSTPTRFVRTSKSTEREDRLDNAVQTMSASISKICEQMAQAPSKQANEQEQLAFQQFYASMDKILTQIPYVDALRFSLDCMERANKLLDQFKSHQTE